jgi:hypothetical protein
LKEFRLALQEDEQSRGNPFSFKGVARKFNESFEHGQGYRLLINILSLNIKPSDKEKGVFNDDSKIEKE